MRYFAEKKWSKPMLIKFGRRISVTFKELSEIYDYFQPFGTFEVLSYDSFIYGDFDNRVQAVYKSRLLEPKYCETHDDGLELSIRDEFWYYSNSRNFWAEKAHIGYSSDYTHYKKIEDLEVTLSGVFIHLDYHLNNPEEETVEQEVITLTEEEFEKMMEFISRD